MLVDKITKKLFGTQDEREVKKMRKVVDKMQLNHNFKIIQMENWLRKQLNLRKDLQREKLLMTY